jgi:AcrR family transcriptional regulator
MPQRRYPVGMGLREIKVARTRDLLVETALRLFLEQGYEQTTMEQIAERAEVGTSTLYRYFPSKDLLILDRIARSLDFAAQLRERPLDEPIEESLGYVIYGALSDVEGDEEFSAIRRLIDAAPVPRARLWDVVLQGRSEFEDLLGERMGAPAQSLLVMVTSRLAYTMFEIIGEQWWAGEHRGVPEARVRSALEELASLELPVPTLPPHRRRVERAG